MKPLSKHPDRIDFLVVATGVVVAKFWLIDGRSIPLHGGEIKPTGFDLEGALAWCEANGYTVRRWEGGARAWKGAPWPIRTRAQILRKRSEVERQALAGRTSGNLLSLDFAFDM
jgi:hypothetical protein